MDLFTQLENVTTQETSKLIKVKKPKIKKVPDTLCLVYNGNTRRFEFLSYNRDKDNNIIKIVSQLSKMFPKSSYLRTTYSKPAIDIFYGYKTTKARISEALINPGNIDIIKNIIKTFNVDINFNLDKIFRKVIKRNSINLSFYESYILEDNIHMYNILEPGMIITDHHEKNQYEYISNITKNHNSFDIKVKNIRNKIEQTISVPTSYGQFCKQFSLDQFSKETVSQKIYYLATTMDERTAKIAHSDIYQRNLKRIDKCPVKLWKYQKNTVAELCIKSKAILSGQMACGKSRQYMAACYAYNTDRNLFIVETKLIDEMLIEFKLFNIKCRIIKDEVDTEFLGKFNITSYDTLKHVVSKKTTKNSKKEKKLTIANLLSKKKIGTLIIDECQNIKNEKSQRTNSLFKIKAKNTILGSGTIITNSMLNLRTYFMLLYFKDSYLIRKSDELSSQTDPINGYWAYLLSRYNRYGFLMAGSINNIHQENTLLTLRDNLDMLHTYSSTAEQLIVTETLRYSAYTLFPENHRKALTYNKIMHIICNEGDENQDTEDIILPDGIDISNLASYTKKSTYKDIDYNYKYNRASTSLSEMMRRHTIRIKSDHPNVLADMTIIKPDTHLDIVSPDAEHIKTYINSAEELTKCLQSSDQSTLYINNLSIFALLSKLIKAALTPQAIGYTKSLTKKQEKVIEILKREILLGKKIICFTKNSWSADYLYKQVKNIKRVRAITMLSKHDIPKRIRALNDFRFRNSNVLITPFSLCRRGYNIPQSSVIIEVDAIWEVETREQAFNRILRPQQKNKPIIYSVVTKNMIDEYMYNNTIKGTDRMGIILDGASDGANIAVNKDSIISMARKILSQAQELNNV